MHRRLPRLAVITAAVVVGIPLLPAAVATVPGQVGAGVPGGTVQSVVVRAPVEGTDDLGARHNQVVRVWSQPGLPLQSCTPGANFDCTFTPLEAVFTRKAGNVTWLPADTFVVAVSTPPVADLTFTLTVAQIYSDGLTAVSTDDLRVVTDLPGIQPLVTTGAFVPLFHTLLFDNPQFDSPQFDSPQFDSTAVGGDLAGTATLTRHSDTTTIDVDVTGLDPLTTYLSHLRSGSCADHGPSYQHVVGGPGEPPNELWPSSDQQDPTAGLTTDADGHVVGSGVAPWVARPEARSVWIHLAGEPGGGDGGGGGGHPPGHLAAAATGEPHPVAIACADLF